MKAVPLLQWLFGAPIACPGRVIVLAYEVSQSRAEYTTMAFRSTRAVVAGRAGRDEVLEETKRRLEP